MKFVASYSGGKESALAVYRAIKQGHEPIALITTFNIDADRSHFHGLSEDVLESVSKSLDIPLWLIKTSGQDYAINLEKALLQGKEQGAQACVFGDIDIEGHLEWCSQRCENVGIKPLFPLWGESRKDVVYEMIDSGFVANISTVNTKYLGEDFLGQQLTKDVAERIAACGVDICGENGEYHTFVSAGPTFKQPVGFSYGEKFMKDGYAILSVHGEMNPSGICRSKYEACHLMCEKDGDITCDFAILTDEAASMTGLLRSLISEEELREELRFVCDIIYNLSPSFRTGIVLTEEERQKLEKITARHKESAGREIKGIVLPMGSQSSALSHVLRVKCKALVRLLCRHNRAGKQVDSLLYDFTNLLSGYFYHLAFKLNSLAGIEEIQFTARK